MVVSLQKNTQLKPLIDKQQISAELHKIARHIDREYADKDLVIVMVLKGAICLVADLLRELHIPCDLETVRCTSYGARGTSRGALQISGLEDLQLEGRDLLVVDDIFDSGHTLTSLVLALEEKGARSIKSLVLLDKKVPKVSDFRPDYVLFEIDNHFVVGYGLDYKERYRGLSGIFLFSEGAP